MSIVTNTFTTYSAKGIREDLSNVITNISPEETPYQSNIGRETITNTLFEWQTDALADAAANAQLEGDDVGPTMPKSAAKPSFCRTLKKWSTKLAAVLSWLIRSPSAALS
jgi:hypothetical protein